MPRKQTKPVTKPTAIAKPPRDPEPLQVEQVVRWMLSGSRDADILAGIAATFPGQPIEPLIAAAVDELAKSAETDADVVKGWCFEATKELYRRMLDIGDLVGALRAVKQLMELAG
jgi:hypothetical protein